jgi:hypothetical protein
MGKGSRARPFDVDNKEFSSNWDKIFGKKDIKEEKSNQNDKPEKPQSDETK